MKDFLNETIQEITSFAENALPRVKERFNQFINRFDTTFSKENKSQRELAEAMVFVFMRAPLFLYALGMHGAAVTELHSLIERLTLEQASRRLSKGSTSEIVENLLERHTLPTLADALFKLDLLNQDDLNFARKLNRLRNSVAHRNPRLVSKSVLSGKKISSLDIDKALSNVDSCDLILKAIKFVPKLAQD